MSYISQPNHILNNKIKISLSCMMGMHEHEINWKAKRIVDDSTIDEVKELSSNMFYVAMEANRKGTNSFKEIRDFILVRDLIKKYNLISRSNDLLDCAKEIQGDYTKLLDWHYDFIRELCELGNVSECAIFEECGTWYFWVTIINDDREDYEKLTNLYLDFRREKLDFAYFELLPFRKDEINKERFSQNSVYIIF